MSEADRDGDVGQLGEGSAGGTKTISVHGSDAPPGGGSLLVLIVDDEAPIAEALALITRDAGYEPLVAEHGQRALALALARPPTLVITDLMMPLLDGAELIAALKARAAQNGHAAPPIILVTAAGPRRAEAAGADAVLRKPFSVAQVEALLLRFLGPPAQRPPTRDTHRD